MWFLAGGMHTLTLLDYFDPYNSYRISAWFDIVIIPLGHMLGALLAFGAYSTAYSVSQDTTSSYQATALSLMTTI